MAVRLGFATPFCLAALVLLGPTAGAAQGGPPAHASLSQNEDGIIRCANWHRYIRDIPRLRRDRGLGQAARLHAHNMRDYDFYSHGDPWGRHARERVALFSDEPWTAWAENIHATPRSPGAACRDWMASSGHRRNILDRRYTHIGAGYARGGRYRKYWVQVFAALE